MATPDAINFMATHGRGLICLTLTKSRVDQLGLELMSRNNGTRHGTAFTTSIEAREGVDTGISAADRARTVSVAIDAAKGRDAIVTPGHVFPLIAVDGGVLVRAGHPFPTRVGGAGGVAPGLAAAARGASVSGAIGAAKGRDDSVTPGDCFPLIAVDGGVLVRAGHTEAAVDIARLAGLNPSGVICEVMNDDGTMARLDDLIPLARRHGLKIGTIADLIAYRHHNDRPVACVSDAPFESDYGGDWRLQSYRNRVDRRVNLVQLCRTDGVAVGIAEGRAEKASRRVRRGDERGRDDVGDRRPHRPCAAPRAQDRNHRRPERLSPPQRPAGRMRSGRAVRVGLWRLLAAQILSQQGRRQRQSG